MSNSVSDNDIQLIARDFPLFEPMSDALKPDCELFHSDHETYIICMKDRDHACWVWTTDFFTVDTIETVYKFACENDLFDGDTVFNMKLNFAETFLKRAWVDFIDITISAIFSDIREPNKKIARVNIRERT